MASKKSNKSQKMTAAEAAAERVAGLDFDAPDATVDSVAAFLNPPTAATGTSKARVEAQDLADALDDLDVDADGGAAVAALRAHGLDNTARLYSLSYKAPDGPREEWDAHLTGSAICGDAETGRVFGIVSDGYRPVQHREAAALIDAALDALGVKNPEVECFGTDHGQHVTMFVDVPELSVDTDLIVNSETFQRAREMVERVHGPGWVPSGPYRDESGKLHRGDLDVRGRVMFKNGHGGSAALEAGVHLTALACRNGLRVSVPGLTCKFSHTKNIGQRVSEMERVIRSILADSERQRENLALYAGTMITAEQFDALAVKLFPGKSAQAQNNREQLAHMYANAPGAAPGTIWGGIQATTFYTSWAQTVHTAGASRARFSLDMPDAQAEQALRRDSALYGSGARRNAIALDWAESIAEPVRLALAG